MKKVLLVVLSLVLLSGCGMSKEEKEELFYKSIEKAYVSVYASESAGLAVLPEEFVEIDGTKWYKVGKSDYDRLEKLTDAVNDVYEGDVRKELLDRIDLEYREIDDALYTVSDGGCPLPYQLIETLPENLKDSVKIKDAGLFGKITFEYDGKEHTAKLNDNKDGYIFSDKVFVCD